MEVGEGGRRVWQVLSNQEHLIAAQAATPFL